MRWWERKIYVCLCLSRDLRIVRRSRLASCPGNFLDLGSSLCISPEVGECLMCLKRFLLQGGRSCRGKCEEMKFKKELEARLNQVRLKGGRDRL